jgi:hypothetical protein
LLRAPTGHAKEALGTQELVAIADRGYYSGDEIVGCEEAGITPVASKPMTSSADSKVVSIRRISSSTPLRESIGVLPAVGSNGDLPGWKMDI